jgi:hypothetical protein
MKLTKLLATRKSILRQAHLAALAHAYYVLQRISARIARVQLSGRVRIQPADPSEERYWPAVTAMEGNQSVIEEHFSDDDIMEFADAIGLAVETDFEEVELSLEDLHEEFVRPLRRTLEQAGVTIDLEKKPRAPRTKTKARL